MCKIKLIDLHRLSYARSLYIQNRLFIKVRDSNKNDERFNYLLLVEHEPVYTVGIRSKEYIDQNIEKKLKQLGAEFVITNRGGLITFHGPGQLVAYPIINLKNFPITMRSVKKFVYLLESSIIDVCSDFSINASRLNGFPGVWINSDRKIAALGIHCSRYVTMHGISINCNVNLKWFDHIIPCGIENKYTTSLSKELNRNIIIDDIKHLFVNHFCKNFQCSIE